MQTLFLRWRLPVVLMILALVVTGCFQGDRDNTDIGVEAAINASPTIEPTDTPVVTETPIETATTLDRPVVERPSETATETPTATSMVIATDAPVTAVAQAGQPSPTPDDLSLTATERIRIITATIYAQETATAIDQGIGETPTAFSTPTATQNPFVTPTLQQVQPQPPVGGGGTGPDCVHQVRAGQTLWRLSFWYGVPVQTLAARNNITNIRLINVGQRITIPNCGTTGFTPPPTFTPTPPPQTGFNPQPPTGGQQPVNPPASVNYLQHTVQQYETLFEISMRYNVPVQQIASANGITNYEYIRMNDVLQIPVTTGTTQQNTFQNTQQQNQQQNTQQQQGFPTPTWTPLAPGVGS